jgi:hypothetical protein
VALTFGKEKIRVRIHGQITFRVLGGLALFVIGFLFFGYAALISWTFRDGMGPDAITSHGSLAFSRFMEDFWIALPITTFSLLLAAWMVRPLFVSLRTATEITNR